MGVHLQTHGLALPPREPGLEDRPTDIFDPGLPEPDAAKIRQWGGTLPLHIPCLDGQPLEAAHLMTLLWQAPQALRGIAAQRLALLGHPLLDVRAHALEQKVQMEQRLGGPSPTDGA